MISKIQGFNHLKGGLNKRWPIKKDISYHYQCDVMQKIGYTINDLNDLLDNIDKTSQKDVVYIVMLASWIQEAVKSLFACYPKEICKNFVYADEDLLNEGRQYLEAIRSFICAHPLKTNRHPEYGLDGTEICVDIRFETKMQSIFGIDKHRYIDFEGIHNGKNDKCDFYLYCYSKESKKKLEFANYIGCSYSDIYEVADLYIKKVIYFDSYLNKLKRKEFLKQNEQIR